jgi:hypothetical protein
VIGAGTTHNLIAEKELYLTVFFRGAEEEEDNGENHANSVQSPSEFGALAASMFMCSASFALRFFCLRNH